VISCAEATKRLWEYLDATIDATTKEALEEHLARCLRCCGELEFARELRQWGTRGCTRGRGAAPEPNPGGTGLMSQNLMHSAEIKDLVRDAYRNVPPTTAAVAHKLYSPEELTAVPDPAINRALGVAKHLRFADIRVGQTILDIGCGGGIDTILAARRTGPSGRVTALDFLPEMLQRTTDAAREAELSNVKPLDGEMEAIPLLDASVDLIISKWCDQPVRPQGSGHGRMRPPAAPRRTPVRVRRDRRMRQLIPPDKHDAVAVALVITAHRPEATSGTS
jgi:SAM-dependent methyltransferase